MGLVNFVNMRGALHKPEGKYISNEISDSFDILPKQEQSSKHLFSLLAAM